jgi:hypothetical protein
MAIQSRSPRSAEALRTDSRDLGPPVAGFVVSELTRALGFTGSFSRIIRCSSSQKAPRSVVVSNGTEPVSSS